jgi:hypothetical protein
MTRYVTRSELAEVLSRSPLPLAATFLAELDPASPELVAVSALDRQGMLATYEVRLERSLAGGGPVTDGLSEFVERLRDVGAEESFRLPETGRTWFGLLGGSGELFGLMAVAHDPAAP